MTISDRFLKIPHLAGLCALLGAAILSGCGTVVEQAMLHDQRAKKLFSPPAMDTHVNGRGWTNTASDGTNAVLILHLEATNYYSLGYHQGKLLAPEIMATYERVMTGAEKFIPKAALKFLPLASERRQVVESILDHARLAMAPFVPPEDQEEMAGLAKVSPTPVTGRLKENLVLIKRIHAIPDLGEATCSALIACKSATTDGHAYQLRILDYGADFGLEKRPMITVYHSTRPYEHAVIDVGWTGFIGLISGMNDQGLAISEMRYAKLEGKTLAGEPMVCLMKRILRRADNAREGAALFRAARRTNGYAYWLGDRAGNAIGILASAGEFHQYSVNTQTEISLGGKNYPQYPDVIYGGHYTEKEGDLVKERRGKLNLQSIQEIARQIRMPSNLQTAIFDLTTGDLWVANRHDNVPAADCAYVHFPREEWLK